MKYTLVGIDGTQDNIPDHYHRSFSSIKCIGTDKLLIGRTFVCLPEFNILAHECTEVKELGNGLFLCTHVDTYSFYSQQAFYDIINDSGKRIGSTYSSVGPLTDGRATVVKYGREGYIDADGNLIPDEQKNLTGNVIEKKYFGYWELSKSDGTILVNIEQKIECAEMLCQGLVRLKSDNGFGLINEEGSKILTCKYESIVLWGKDLLKIGENSRGYKPSVFYVIVDKAGNTVTLQQYSQISELEDGKAAIVYQGMNGYIDEHGHPLHDHEIKLEDGCVKYSILGKWGICGADGQGILSCSYTEITTYHGCYLGIKDSVVSQTTIKTSNVIPVTGRRSGETQKSIIFNVGGKGFLVSKTNAKNTWKDEIPSSADLIITNVCKSKPKCRGYEPKVSIIAKPFSAKIVKTRNFHNGEIGEIVNGQISWVQNGNVIVKIADGTTVFVHRTNFKDMKVGKEYKNKNITIKKIGVDDIHKKDKWEIISIG